MYVYISLSALITLVNAVTICDICVCTYENDIDNDFTGETVNCAYTNVNTTYILPVLIYSLDLSTNNISSVHSSLLFQSKTLKRLSLNNNLITEIGKDAFQLPQLKWLDLKDNSLDTLHSDVFSTLGSLEFLNLANNRFTTFEKLTFHHLSNLKEIVLDNNSLGPSLEETNLFDRSGYGLTNKIQSISVKGIRLLQVPENFFVDAYDLRKLNIANNGLEEIFELPFTLEYLDLSDNPITYISAEDFANLPALKELNLNNLGIANVPENCFASLHSLVKLDIERNMNLTDFSALAFGQEVLSDADDLILERLSLKGSRLSKLDSVLVVPFGQLIELDLQGNPWKCDCNLVWLKQLQISKRDYDHLRCFTPTPFYNARIFELPDKFFTCPVDRSNTALTMAIVCFCVILSTIAVWIFVFLPKSQSRCHMLRDMYGPSTAYSVLPVMPGNHVSDI